MRAEREGVRAWRASTRSSLTFSPLAKAGARKEEQRILVFNLGIALEDLATGVEILNRARKKKVGTLLPA